MFPCNFEKISELIYYRKTVGACFCMSVCYCHTSVINQMLFFIVAISLNAIKKCKIRNHLHCCFWLKKIYWFRQRENVWRKYNITNTSREEIIFWMNTTLKKHLYIQNDFFTWYIAFLTLQPILLTQKYHTECTVETKFQPK